MICAFATGGYKSAAVTVSIAAVLAIATAAQNTADTAQTTANAALPKAGGEMVGSITFSGLQTVDGVDISVRDAVLSSTTTLAQAALPVSGGTLHGDVTVDTGITFDGKDVSTLGSDVRAYKTRTFEISLAALQAKGAVTNATFTLTAMDARDMVIWAWYQNAGTTFTSSGTVSGVYASIGRTADPDSIYIERDIKAAYTVEDNNDNHGLEFPAYAEMGDKFYAAQGGDASTYYGKSYTIVCKVTLTGGSTMAQLTGGGPIYLNVVMTRVDTTQLEAAQ